MDFKNDGSRSYMGGGDMMGGRGTSGSKTTVAPMQRRRSYDCLSAVVELMVVILDEDSDNGGDDNNNNNDDEGANTGEEQGVGDVGVCKRSRRQPVQSKSNVPPVDGHDDDVVRPSFGQGSEKRLVGRV